MIIISCLFALVYIGAISLFYKYQKSTPKLVDRPVSTSEVTYLIAIKDGADSLENTLHNLNWFAEEGQSVVLVFNGCKDDSKEIATQFFEKNQKLKSELVTLAEANKKQAILAGAKQVQTKFIWLLDVDIALTRKCNEVLDKTENSDITLFPIALKVNKSAFGTMQLFEWSLLQFLTVNIKNTENSLLANGANMLVKSDWLKQHNPFKTNMHIPTGDDIFLLQYVLELGGEVKTYNQNTFCETLAPSTWKAFFKQRKRWASKNYGLSTLPQQVGKAVFLCRFLLPYILVIESLFFLTGWAVIPILVTAWLELIMTKKSKISFLSRLFFSFVLPFVYLPVLIQSKKESLKYHQANA